jgi:NADH-quinone oxidoreductase subunit J
LNAQFYTFVLLAIIAISGGIGLSITKNVVHGALSLLATLLASAGIFIVLSAGFIALVQILIYGGAVTILLLFALMLSNANEQNEAVDNHQKPIAIAASIAIFLASTVVILQTQWATRSENGEAITMVQLGNNLFTNWIIPFEIISVILLIAMIGAVVIASPEGDQ